MKSNTRLWILFALMVLALAVMEALGVRPPADALYSSGCGCTLP